jgi:hypothetical protein
MAVAKEHRVEVSDQSSSNAWLLPHNETATERSVLPLRTRTAQPCG